MRQYTNPVTQAAVDNMQQNIIRADRIIADMKYTTQLLGRREMDKNQIVLTQSQRDTIAKNKGIHIYGKSHPLYKGDK